MLHVSSSPPDRVFDLCVIGAGPVGLSLALESSRLGLEVLLLEAGPRRRPGRSRTAPVAPVRLTHPAHHAALAETTSAGLGGTSSIWGGKCVPFGRIDFEERTHVPRSRWPITYEEVARWHGRAADLLQCGDGFSAARPAWPDLAPIATDQQERWSRHSVLAGSRGAQAGAEAGVTVLCDATVTELRVGGDGSTVTQAEVLVAGRTVAVSAARFAVAAGGLKTTRLLLELRRRHPRLLGGTDGPLGRGYAGHLTGSIADLVLSSPDDFGRFDLQPDPDGCYVRRRLTIGDAAQRDQQLLNTAFYLGNLPFSDFRHGNGALSALFLALRTPVVGARLARRDTRENNVLSGWPDYARHLRNVGRRPLRTAHDLAAIVRRRVLARSPMKVFVVPSRQGTYALRYHAEQTCRPENRVYLEDAPPGGGAPAVAVDFRYSDQDVDSVLRAHAVLDQQLRAAGHGRLAYRVGAERRHQAVLEQARDGYHQIGSTAMGADPSTGVVDRDCRVFGLSNLYVASSSVFPTAGEANPTFTAVCLAVRLAHHLAGADRATAPAGAAPPHPAVP